MSATAAAERSAVLLVEFQNQWTLRGSYHRLIRGQLTSRKVVANTKALVSAARRVGVAVIHAPLIVDPARKKGWLAHLTFGKVFTRGTWKSNITDGLLAEGDHVVHDRYAFDAFRGTDLEVMLRRLSVEHLFVCGFTTDQCVSRTLRTALDLGFDTHLVSDCTATLNGWLQRRAERRFGPRVIKHEDLLPAFTATSVREGGGVATAARPSAQPAEHRVLRGRHEREAW